MVRQPVHLDCRDGRLAATWPQQGRMAHHDLRHVMQRSDGAPALQPLVVTMPSNFQQHYDAPHDGCWRAHLRGLHACCTAALKLPQGQNMTPLNPSLSTQGPVAGAGARLRMPHAGRAAAGRAGGGAPAERAGAAALHGGVLICLLLVCLPGARPHDLSICASRSPKKPYLNCSARAVLC